MTFEPTPRIGDWYRNTTGETFEIVARDDDDETLELQYYDGTIEELDAESWEYIHPEPIEPPEDWRGSLDVAREDSQHSEIWSETEDWLRQLESMDGPPG
jgi:hypothetical protein